MTSKVRKIGGNSTYEKFNDRLPFAYNFLRMKLQTRMRTLKQKTLNQLRDKITKKKTKHLKRSTQMKI